MLQASEGPSAFPQPPGLRLHRQQWPRPRAATGPCLLLALADAAPLSAPAFSLVFPLLKMVLTEMPHHTEEEEEQMAQILQILTVHAQLRASSSIPPGRVDEVGRICSPLIYNGVGEAGACDTLDP